MRDRRIPAAIGLTGVLLTTLLSTTGADQPAAADPTTDSTATTDSTGTTDPADTGDGTQITDANPYLSLQPGPSTDDDAWRARMRADGKKRAAEVERRKTASKLPEPIVVDDDEPAGEHGSNDTVGSAQPVEGFGTTRSANPRARMLGELAPEAIEPEAVKPSGEDDGAIPKARDTGIGTERNGITTTGTIGDGPHGSKGSKSGDFDFYRVELAKRQTLSLDVSASGGELAPAAVLFDADGQTLTAAQDLTGAGSTSVHLSYPAAKAGTYYVSVGSATPWPHPLDPQDSGSGAGVGTEGPYDLSITAGVADTDMYAVDLRAGDTLGATVSGKARQLAVYDADGRQVHGSSMDASGIYPASSPLPGGGNATLEHVAAGDGTHYVAITDGTGRYDAKVEAYRSSGVTENKPQTIFLDFDGARFNNTIFGEVATEPGVRETSPLSAYLARWGLSRSDEDRVIDLVTAKVERQLEHTLSAHGRPSAVDVRNSRDDEDTFGEDGVSRVIVGGSVKEAGIMPVVGISQSIDPGNLAREETALVLLDRISEPADQPVSLNAYLSEDSDRVRAVSNAVANFVAHEAGHYLGNWHTHDGNDVANVMDTGNYVTAFYQVGPDGVAGTDDDVELEFAEDEFEPLQGFVGAENSPARTAYAVSRRGAGEAKPVGRSDG